MRYGLDLLAAAKFEKVAVNNLPFGFSLGGFDNTFGDFLPVALRAIAKGCKHIRIQELWSDTHTFGDSDIPKIKSISKKWQTVAVQNPDVQIELSCFCEHNHKNPDKYHAIVEEHAPNCRPVNTPWQGAMSKKYKNEVHGGTRVPNGPYNYSFDGTNCVDENVEELKKIHKCADTFFLWHPRFNLKWSMKDTTPRPDRKAFPTRELIESVMYLSSPKGKTKIPNKWLIKSHAERHGADDLKGDKLLIIAHIKAEAIELKRGTKVVDVLKYYGSYDGGGWRYYSTRMGYTLGADLEIWVNNKKVGRCNPGFRDGYWR